MPFKKYTLKLKENNNIINQNLPRFSLSYRTKREDPRHVSYDIITALSENSDIIIELDTNFFDNKLNIDGQCFQRFIDAAKSLGLTHSYKEFASTHSYSIFGFRVESSKKNKYKNLWFMFPTMYGRTSHLRISCRFPARGTILQTIPWKLKISLTKY